MNKVTITLALLAFVLNAQMVQAVGAQERAGEQANLPEASDQTDIIPAEQQMQAGQDEQGQEVNDDQTNQQGEIAEERVPEGIADRIRQREQEMEREMEGLGKAQREVVRNQNEVRLAVHALLAMDDMDMMGGIGQEVAEVAREFDNSIMATIQAEEKIQKRNKLAKLLVGGDMKSAEEIEQEVNKNQERIQLLIQLRENCEDCNEEVMAMFQEQITKMIQEQERLQQLAQDEKRSKGLFGWLWK